MFYYLLYNSSFSFIVENRLFSTVLYGSILYILTHAVLNYCVVSILTIINNYYWTLLSLDIISFTYAIYNSIINNNDINNNSNDVSGEDNSMNVSFNLLKNKINTMFDRKNDLTITHIPNTNNSNNSNNTNNSNNNQLNNRKNKNQLQEHFNNTENNDNVNYLNSDNFIDTHRSKNKDPLDDLDFTDLENIAPPSNELNSSAQFSTPINRLKKNNVVMNNNTTMNNNTSNSNSSTPISLIRNNVKIQEPLITHNNDNLNNTDTCNESTAGSDVGSVMDLADFENSF